MHPELEEAFVAAVQRVADDLNHYPREVLLTNGTLEASLRSVLLEFAADCLAEAYVPSATETQARIRIRIREMRREAGIEEES